MKTAFRKSFERDLKKIKDKDVLRRVGRVIEKAEAVSDLSGIGDVVKITGTQDCYRIRIGDSEFSYLQ